MSNFNPFMCLGLFRQVRLFIDTGDCENPSIARFKGKNIDPKKLVFGIMRHELKQWAETKDDMEFVITSAKDIFPEYSDNIDKWVILL